MQPLGNFEALAWQIFEEYGRANFGVQQYVIDIQENIECNNSRKYIKNIHKSIGWKRNSNSRETPETSRKVLNGKTTYSEKILEMFTKALNTKGDLNPGNALETSRKELDEEENKLGDLQESIGYEGCYPNSEIY